MDSVAPPRPLLLVGAGSGGSVDPKTVRGGRPGVLHSLSAGTPGRPHPLPTVIAPTGVLSMWTPYLGVPSLSPHPCSPPLVRTLRMLPLLKSLQFNTQFERSLFPTQKDPD